MRQCKQCGQVKENAFFLPKRKYERDRGDLTTSCLDCRERRNKARKSWYHSNEKDRIKQPATT